ncbi:hypothetical protein GCM10010178_84610 [Lentzea flava]|uniref:Resolvase, N terminal domain n=1 Tax=Lentzea flava TaxID=103732 RepID=A0ABQ2VDM6_9PSEU|nr:hypothetical protein GCM10010178_84610 [Lentzea flava]
MNRVADSCLAGTRLAFWGYTNCPDAGAAVDLARQLRRCEGALNDGVTITRFFYEMPVAVDGRVAQAVCEAGGPSRCDRGWDALAAALSDVDRGFEGIVCASFDRIGRAASRFRSREQLVTAHGGRAACR